MVTGCAINFLKKRHSSYDIIICDPPSFSQSKRKGVEPFQVQDDALDLMNHCFKNLKANGWVLFSNNYRKFSMEEIAERYNVDELTPKCAPKTLKASGVAGAGKLGRIINQLLLEF